MKIMEFTNKEVLWVTTKAEFDETQKMLDELLPGAKAIIFSDEIVNDTLTDEELELLGLNRKDINSKKINVISKKQEVKKYISEIKLKEKIEKKFETEFGSLRSCSLNINFNGKIEKKEIFFYGYFSKVTNFKKGNDLERKKQNKKTNFIEKEEINQEKNYFIEKIESEITEKNNRVMI